VAGNSVPEAVSAALAAAFLVEYKPHFISSNTGN
jgi:hypothetical protein